METFKSMAPASENGDAAPTKTYGDMFNNYKARKEILAKVRPPFHSNSVYVRQGNWT